MTFLDAVVLDLDDTLFDTTRVLLPPADRRAVRALIAAGLALPEEEALARVASIRSSGRADQVFRVLAGERGLPAAAAEAAEDAFFRYDVPPLTLDPRVADALDALSDLAPLALLTSGVPATQRQKVARLGIAARFSAFVVCDPFAGESKHAALGDLLRGRSWTAERVVVVGDSLASDIGAAVANGCLGVWVRAGGERRDDAAAHGVRPWRSVAHVGDVPAALAAAGFAARSR